MARRCAIYTRQSHDERADAALGGIDRQRELCEAYVASQAGEGWTALPDRFDDPGRSGGSTVRPGLQRLLRAVEAGEVDVIVVHKLDRLSRSQRDLLGLIDRFERANVTFVSITQSFSTTTSMGRFALGIMIAFAQLEREMTGDRTRERNAVARSKGLWTAGPAPFGYRLEGARLVVHPERAAIVEMIHRRFARLKSVRHVVAELRAAGHRNRQNNPFTARHVMYVLQSRVYRGELPHAGGFVPGLHPPLISERRWRRIQDMLHEIGAKTHRW